MNPYRYDLAESWTDVHKPDDRSVEKEFIGEKIQR